MVQDGLKKWPYALAVGIWLIFAASGTIRAEEYPDPFPGFAASAYLLKIQGRILWARSPDRELAPASLTKIMTALLAVRRSRLDDPAVVSRDAARETGTRLGLKQGEEMYTGFLLAATLLRSANDACHALADHVAGSEKAFVSLMNGEARTLGMEHTRFRNACGHDQPGHYSTARDLSLLAEEALREPVFSDLVATVRLDISTKGGKRVFPLENKNELVGRYPGAAGVKTGFTDKAGKCVIALAERDGVRVLLVVLNAPDRWWGATDLLDAAFAQARGAKRESGP
jgi:D-alanyl-D-alanine carboxypeptidase (penicillin-binding protein 5/6)